MGSKEEVTTVARKSTLTLFISFGLAISSYVGFLFVARYMGAETWGMIGFALGLVGMFLQTDFGFVMAHKKKVSEGNDVGECIGAYVKIKAILIIISVSIVFGILFSWENVLGHGYEDPMIKSVVYLILAYYILFSLAQIPIQTFGGLRQIAKQQMPEFFGVLSRTPIVIFVALSSLGVIALAFSYVVTGLLMVLVGFYLLRRFQVKNPSKPLMKSYVRFAAPITIYMLFSTVSLNIDKIAIQFFWNSTEVGYFFGMQRVTVIMSVIAVSLIPIFLPSISHHHAKRNKKTIRRLLSTAERYISMILTPLVVVFSVLSLPLIHILVGDSFLPATTVLALLSIYSLFLSLKIPNMQTLYGCGRPGLAATAGLSIALTNIVLLFIFVPRELFGISLFGLGAEGAALSTVISAIVGYIMVKRYIRRVIKVRFNFKILKHWMAGFVMALLLWEYSSIFPPARWYELIIASGIGFLCYMGLLILFREFKKKDLNFFMDILNPRKLGQYAKGEFKGKDE